MSMKIRAALIVDNGRLTIWQRQALEEASEYLDVQLVLNCTNTVTQKNIPKHFLYYVLNLLALRNPLTRRVPLAPGDAEIISFESSLEGAWQSIPPAIAQQVAVRDIKLVIKFGMSLLRIDGSLASLDILSFHHGDPEHYRGRPAGFYELHDNAPRVGVIVQKLSNTLDGGDVMARIHCKAHHHSYRKTALSFYGSSRHLLRKALHNYSRNRIVRLEKLGPNYRLPGNLLVLRFALKLLGRKIKRVLYGAFYEKKWNLVVRDFTGMTSLSDMTVAPGRVPEPVAGFVFYADPFFSVRGDRIRAEALSAASGLGEIVELDAKDFHFIRTVLRGGHFSYPFCVEDDRTEYLLPEVASQSGPYLLPEPFDATSAMPLLGLEDQRLADATLLKHQGRYYLFAGKAGSAADTLYLFHSDALAGPYLAHPQNPIVIDSASARMAGRVLCRDGALFRFGQNNCYGYGNGITVNLIEELSAETYSERHAGSLSFRDTHGPHTIDIRGDRTILDFYSEAFSPLAGYRRVSRALSRRRRRT